MSTQDVLSSSCPFSSSSHSTGSATATPPGPILSRPATLSPLSRPMHVFPSLSYFLHLVGPSLFLFLWSSSWFSSSLPDASSAPSSVVAFLISWSGAPLLFSAFSKPHHCSQTLNTVSLLVTPECLFVIQESDFYPFPEFTHCDV